MEIGRNQAFVSDFLDFDKVRVKPAGRRIGIKTLRRLPGDASTRLYFRMTDQSGSWIVVRQDRFDRGSRDLPFLSVQSLLERNGIAVPKIFGVSPKEGVLFLEDLGDETLLHRLARIKDHAEQLRLYRSAVELLVELQSRCLPNRNAGDLEAFELAFDTPKLMWEVDFTIEHLFRGYLKRKMSPRDLRVMRDGFRTLCQRLAREPRVFTHRDFHSRNLMVDSATDALSVIDFQDARMGPAQYDLASLLKDCYYRLEDGVVEKLKTLYRDRMGRALGKRFSAAQFDRVFDWMTIQRSFKAMGSFASFYQTRGNPIYLRYLGTAFENMRNALMNTPEHRRLREVILAYY